MKTITIIVILMATAANALAGPNDYRLFYLVNGKETKAEEALLASLRGQSVVKCQAVKAKANKTGSSIGFKNIKKPQIEE